MNPDFSGRPSFRLLDLALVHSVQQQRARNGS